MLVVAFVTLGQGGGRAGNRGAPPPASTLSMRLVDSSSSPFASVGAGPQTGDLECVTASVCYASDTSGSAPAGSGVERTADGGANVAPYCVLTRRNGAVMASVLSDHRDLPRRGANGRVRCGCARAVLRVRRPPTGVTRAHHRSRPRAAGLVRRIHRSDRLCHGAGVCGGTPSNCVEGSAAAAGTFVSTSDGGKTWVAAAVVPPAVSTRSDPAVRPRWRLHRVGTGGDGPESGHGRSRVAALDRQSPRPPPSSPLAVGAGVLLLSAATPCTAWRRTPRWEEGRSPWPRLQMVAPAGG